MELSVGQILEQVSHFTLTIAAVAAKSTNRGEFACLRPTSDRLWIDAK